MKVQNLRQKKWYIIDSKSKGNYSKDDPIKFLIPLYRIKSL